MCFMFFSEQAMWRAERGRWRDAAGVGGRGRQVVRRLRAAAPAVRVPAAGSGSAQLSVVGPPRDAREDEQPSFLMGVRSPRWVTQPAASLRARARRQARPTSTSHSMWHSTWRTLVNFSPNWERLKWLKNCEMNISSAKTCPLNLNNAIMNVLEVFNVIMCLKCNSHNKDV